MSMNVTSTTMAHTGGAEAYEGSSIDKDFVAQIKENAAEASKNNTGRPSQEFLDQQAAIFERAEVKSFLSSYSPTRTDSPTGYSLQAKNTKSKENVSQKNEDKLSEKAQDYLKNLREKYGDYDFMVGNNSDEMKTLAKGGSKEISVIFSNAELERMATDEKYADEKMQGVEGAVKMAKRVAEENGFNAAFGDGEGTKGTINKIAISIGEDGNAKIFAELEKSSEKQRERIEKAREKRAEEKKKNEKNKANPYEERKKEAVKRTTIEADSMEDFMEKLNEVDWDKVKDSRSGDRFNFMA